MNNTTTTTTSTQLNQEREELNNLFTNFNLEIEENINRQLVDENVNESNNDDNISLMTNNSEYIEDIVDDFAYGIDLAILLARGIGLSDNVLENFENVDDLVKELDNKITIEAENQNEALEQNAINVENEMNNVKEEVEKSNEEVKQSEEELKKDQELRTARVNAYLRRATGFFIGGIAILGTPGGAALIGVISTYIGRPNRTTPTRGSIITEVSHFLATPQGREVITGAVALGVMKYGVKFLALFKK